MRPQRFKCYLRPKDSLELDIEAPAYLKEPFSLDRVPSKGEILYFAIRHPSRHKIMRARCKVSRIAQHDYGPKSETEYFIAVEPLDSESPYVYGDWIWDTRLFSFEDEVPYHDLGIFKRVRLRILRILESLLDKFRSNWS